MDARQHGFFLAKKRRFSTLRTFDEADRKAEGGDRRSATPGTPGNDLGYDWIVGSLAGFGEGFFEGTEAEDRFVCFADPSTYESYPGWMLRNLLVLVSRKWKLRQVQILCYRDIQARRHEAHSIILPLEQCESRTSEIVRDRESPSISEMPKVTGWERNNTGKVMSKVANLGEYMDPLRLVSLTSHMQRLTFQVGGSSSRSELEINQVAHCTSTELGYYQRHQVPSPRRWDSW